MDRKARLSIQFLPAGGEKIQSTLVALNINPRPLAGPGVWLMFLLPSTILISQFRFPEASEVYHLSSLLSLGLIVAGVIFLIAIYTTDRNCVHSFNTGMIFPFTLTTLQLYLLHERGLVFSVVCGLIVSYVFIWGFLTLMRMCPLCFTFGEAALVTQAVILFLFSSMANVYKAWYNTPETDMEIATLTLQVGLVGVLTICVILYILPETGATGPFYGIVFSVLFFGVIPVLHVLLNRSPVLWIMLLLLADDMTTMSLFSYWVLCVGMAVLAVMNQVNKKQQANTVVRKYFHILAVAVYIPGLVYSCCLLYLASGVVLALFVVLELARILCIPPLGSGLQEGFLMYADEKDAGNMALTPVYLLAGCSLPLWLHPVGCTSPSSLLALCSGLLSIGIGDTLASSIGSRFGREKWPGTHKTVEGTVACVTGQLLAVGIMYFVGIPLEFSCWTLLKLPASVIATAWVEAQTDQVDNIVLPLIGYMLLPYFLRISHTEQYYAGDGGHMIPQN